MESYFLLSNGNFGIDLFIAFGVPVLLAPTFLSCFIYLCICVSTVLVNLGRFFSFLILYTVGTAPWTGDQTVARPLPTHRINLTDIHAFSGNRTHDPSVQVGEDGLCRRPLGYRDRLASERAKTVHAVNRAATVIEPVTV
jgi:hypothetical protein